MISATLFEIHSFFLARRLFYLSLLYETAVCPFSQNQSAVFQHFHCFTAAHPLSFTDYGRIVAPSRPLVNASNTTFPWDFFMKTALFCKCNYVSCIYARKDGRTRRFRRLILTHFRQFANFFTKRFTIYSLASRSSTSGRGASAPSPHLRSSACRKSRSQTCGFLGSRGP